MKGHQTAGVAGARRPWPAVGAHRASTAWLVGLWLALAGGALMWAAPLRAQPLAQVLADLPPPEGIADAAQAQTVLLQARQARGHLESRRRAALAECATRFLANRCSDDVQRQFRLASHRLSGLERKADEIIREARNRQRTEEQVRRERDRRERAEQAPQRESAARQRERDRQAEREQRERDAQAREQAAPANRARYEERVRARDERLSTPVAPPNAGRDRPSN